jgi:hypothetical protein
MTLKLQFPEKKLSCREHEAFPLPLCGAHSARGPLLGFVPTIWKFMCLEDAKSQKFSASRRNGEIAVLFPAVCRVLCLVQGDKCISES